MLQITKEGRVLVRSATGAKAYRPGSPGTLKEWHWKALATAWKARPEGVKDENGYYGHIGWNTLLIEADFKDAVFLIGNSFRSTHIGIPLPFLTSV